jgi:RimJ/RimL family protein N-acetyltransferase
MQNGQRAPGSNHSGNVTLREVRASDLPIFFANQLDPEANWMAAFAAEDPTDRDAFDAHWARIVANETITTRTILVGDEVAGNIVAFPAGGVLDVGYWLGKRFWGRGIATRALAAFLEIVTVRPLHAHVAHDNIASRRVLEKCGFIVTGHGSAPSDPRGGLVDELVLTLPASPRPDRRPG